MIALKQTSFISCSLIVLLAYLSTLAIGYTYCELLNFECKPDALNAVGEIFHTVSVALPCLIIYAFLPNKYKNLADGNEV